MRLAKLSEFRRTFFTPDSAPSERTLRMQIAAGKVPGGTFQMGHYYVDLDEYARTTRLRERLAQQNSELEDDLRRAGLI